MNEQKKESRIWLTREGFVYLTVLLFVTVGAVLRSVNLLIFMAGMMSMPLFLNWRLLRYLFKKYRLSRTIPQRIHAGQLINIQWEAQNLSQRMSAWNLCVTDQIERVIDTTDATEQEDAESTVEVIRLSRPKNREEYAQWRAQQKSAQKPAKPKRSAKQFEKVNVTFTQIDPVQSEFRSYRCLFAKRGLYQVGPAVASSLFPFGLMSGKLNLPGTKQVFVAPKLGTLTPTWDRRQQSLALGSEATNRKLGTNEDEFYAIRQWRSGDNQRHIHWRSTAKRQTPMVRQFDQLSNRDMALVLDLFVPAPEETPLETSHDEFAERCEIALSFAATVLSESAHAVQGRVGISVCGEESSVIIDRNHHEFTARIMRELAIARPGAGAELEQAIQHVASKVSTGTPIYVVSSRPRPDNFGKSWGTNQALNKSIQWLDVESDAFHQLFSIDRQREQNQMDDLQQRWVSRASS